MKHLLYVFFFSVLITAFAAQRFDSPELTQMVVTLPELNSKELQIALESDIHKLSGIQFIETSLITKTLIINYDSRKMFPEDVEYILNKWGCTLGESSFQNIVSME